ncbi:MAG: hypothetical protein US97_C0039G0012 [Microgenomates group bacterium GW2011_GWF1_38_5]|nr:MAG: hypothetical protein US97_C0039G0012 [Microgenomates group bacterium GW2011_GWF1_38_5]
MKPRICVGVPTADFIRTKTVATLCSLVKRDPTIAIQIKQGCYVHKNREEIVVDAQKMGGFTHLFFVDSDQCFSADVLERLLSREADIIAAPYKYRNESGDWVLCLTEKSNAHEKEIPDKLFTAYAAGTGCMLIKMSVFDKIPRPWFTLGPPEMQTGEDIFFCKKAQEYGYKIWVDPSVEISHIGEYLF